MTLVAAAQFGERITIMADTAITDPNSHKPNIIPGRLKAVVIGSHVSVAYAGRSAAGTDAVREARKKLQSSGDVEKVIQGLCSITEEDDCDFILASHLRGPELRKISSGSISGSQQFQWAGDHELVGKLTAAMEQTRENPNSYVDEEATFLTAFSNILLQNVRPTTVTGGMPINLFASPCGHTYQAMAFSCMNRPIRLGKPEAEQEAHLGGGDVYRGRVVNTDFRGAGVVGIFFDEGNVGYVYSPLEWDDPLHLNSTSEEHVRAEVEKCCERLGGVRGVISLEQNH